MMKLIAASHENDLAGNTFIGILLNIGWLALVLIIYGFPTTGATFSELPAGHAGHDHQSFLHQCARRISQVVPEQIQKTASSADLLVQEQLQKSSY